METRNWHVSANKEVLHVVSGASSLHHEARGGPCSIVRGREYQIRVKLKPICRTGHFVTYMSALRSYITGQTRYSGIYTKHQDLFKKRCPDFA